jgi:hypothetical protein
LGLALFDRLEQIGVRANTMLGSLKILSNTPPTIAEQRMLLTPNGNVRYQPKTPYRDGTTHVIFEPFDFIARLAALVPKLRVNLTRFHGVFVPNSKHRAMVPSRNLNVRFEVTGTPFSYACFGLQRVDYCRAADPPGCRLGVAGQPAACSAG